MSRPTTETEADEFARSWIDAWNSHDVDRIVAHYRDDIEYESPFVARISPGRTRLSGGAAVREYVAGALERFPDLHFDPPQVVALGADSVALVYGASTTSPRSRRSCSTPTASSSAPCATTARPPVDRLPVRRAARSDQLPDQTSCQIRPAARSDQLPDQTSWWSISVPTSRRSSDVRPTNSTPTLTKPNRLAVELRITHRELQRGERGRGARVEADDEVALLALRRPRRTEELEADARARDVENAAFRPARLALVGKEIGAEPAGPLAGVAPTFPAPGLPVADHALISAPAHPGISAIALCRARAGCHAGGTIVVRAPSTSERRHERVHGWVSRRCGRSACRSGSGPSTPCSPSTSRSAAVRSSATWGRTARARRRRSG